MMFAGTSLFAGNDATSSPSSVPEKTLKVLMIGNSFSICVGEYLPQITDSVPGCKVDLTSAYIGGCSLQTHAQHLEAAEKDPSLKPYRISRWFDKTHKSYAGNVNTLLKEQKWDIITIQQASHYSWRYETFEPYVEKLASYIRKHAPHAEIVIQQTWAYRSDHGLFRNSKGKLSQEIMYKGLVENYNDLAVILDLNKNIVALLVGGLEVRDLHRADLFLYLIRNNILSLSCLGGIVCRLARRGAGDEHKRNSANCQRKADELNNFFHLFNSFQILYLIILSKHCEIVKKIF